MLEFTFYCNNQCDTIKQFSIAKRRKESCPWNASENKRMWFAFWQYLYSSVIYLNTCANDTSHFLGKKQRQSISFVCSRFAFLLIQ